MARYVSAKHRYVGSNPTVGLWLQLDKGCNPFYNLHMKICKKCQTELDNEAFSKDKSRRDGLSDICKPCAAKKFSKWSKAKPSTRRKNAEWKKARVSQNRWNYVQLMRGKSCVDCGYDNILALVWDHVRGEKIKGVASMVTDGSPWNKILEEIDKCELRCHNCHAIVTAQRGNWWLTQAVKVYLYHPELIDAQLVIDGDPRHDG